MSASLTALPELGLMALLLAFGFALAQVVVPSIGVWRNNATWQLWAKPLVFAQVVSVSLSFSMLVASFLADDFSVAYVAAHSNTDLPVMYKISAAWSAHEGSLLLWVLLLGLWSVAVAQWSRSLPLEMLARVLVVLGAVSLGFIAFTVLTSNPFIRLLPNVPTNGADLNPMLQDIGLIVHPPMLYMGYVGLAVAFAFALASLSKGELNARWTRWSRPWTLLAWVCLTLGIVLGSWWAYYELGWGGWWFWDPVENASLLPWLVSTALLHSLAVSEKRGAFNSWTVLLAIFAFSLSLLGTFLVRSGVLTSVHAFAADPSRGVFILALLGGCVGGSLLLYALQAPKLAQPVRYDGLSRERFLLLNNVLLVVLALTILLGTLYPLLIAALGLGKLSVGAAWFNTACLPTVMLLLLLLPVGSQLRWRSDTLARLKRNLMAVAVASVLLAWLLPWLLAGFSVAVSVGLLLAMMVALGTLANVWQQLSSHEQTRAITTLPHAWRALRGLTASYWGMVVAHLGVAVLVAGVTLVSQGSVEHSQRMKVGDRAKLGSYTFVFEDMKRIRGANYDAYAGVFALYHHGQFATRLLAEKRKYRAQGTIMTEAAIKAGVVQDIYMTLGEPLSNGAWAVRFQIKPFMRWVWLGGIMMAVGGVLAMFDQRYRPRRHRPTLTKELS